MALLRLGGLLVFFLFVFAAGCSQQTVGIFSNAALSAYNQGAEARSYKRVVKVFNKHNRKRAAQGLQPMGWCSMLHQMVSVDPDSYYRNMVTRWLVNDINCQLYLQAVRKRKK